MSRNQRVNISALAHGGHRHRCAASVPWLGKTSACRFHISLSCAIFCKMVPFQYWSSSSHRYSVPFRKVSVWWEARWMYKQIQLSWLTAAPDGALLSADMFQSQTRIFSINIPTNGRVIMLNHKQPQNASNHDMN